MITSRSARRLLYFTTAFYVLALITLTHMPIDFVIADDLRYQSRVFWVDKIVHALLYTGLTTLLFLCAPPVEHDTATGDLLILPGRFLVLTLLIVLLGLIDELTQPYVGRRFELLDLAADSVAVFPGASLFLMIQLSLQSVR